MKKRNERQAAPVAARSKALACSSSIAGIAVSSPAEEMALRPLCLFCAV